MRDKDSKYMVKRSSWLRTILGFFLSSALLWVTIKKSNLHIETLYLNKMQWIYFGCACVLFVVAVFLLALRAKLIWIDQIKNNSSFKTFEALCIGNFYNCVLPGNLGEGVRAYYFSRLHHLPFTFSLATIFTEKWIDAQLFVGLALILFATKPITLNLTTYIIVNTAVVVYIAGIAYYAMRTFRPLEIRVWHTLFLAGRAGKYLYRIYWNVNFQISVLKRKRNLSKFVILSLSIFSINTLQFYTLMQVAGIDYPVGSIYSAYFIAVSMIIIMFVPSAPSSIGVLHYGIYSVLVFIETQCNVLPTADGLQKYAMYAVYLHLSCFLPEVLIGIYYIIKEQDLLFGKRDLSL